jgi:CBS domain-containing protein
VESGRLVGLITERDVLRAVADGLSTDVVGVGSYMRPAQGVIGPEAPAAEAAARMMEQRVRHLLVVRESEVVGLLSAADVLSQWGVPALLADD